MKNNGADQTAQMHKLICAFVFCISHKTSFFIKGRISFYHELFLKKHANLQENNIMIGSA